MMINEDGPPEPDFPTQDQSVNLCKIGLGPAGCRYLTLHAKGWSCEKHSAFGRLLDARVATGKMIEVGDNCAGLKSRSRPRGVL